MNGEKAMETRMGAVEQSVNLLTASVEALQKANAHHDTEIALLRQSGDSTLKAVEKIEGHMAKVTTILDERTGGQKYLKTALWVIGILLSALVALSALEHTSSLFKNVGELIRPLHNISRTVEAENDQHSSMSAGVPPSFESYQP